MNNHSWRYTDNLIFALTALEIKYKVIERLTEDKKRVTFIASKKELANIKELMEENLK